KPGAPQSTHLPRPQFPRARRNSARYTAPFPCFPPSLPPPGECRVVPPREVHLRDPESACEYCFSGAAASPVGYIREEAASENQFRPLGAASFPLRTRKVSGLQFAVASRSQSQHAPSPFLCDGPQFVANGAAAPSGRSRP